MSNDAYDKTANYDSSEDDKTGVYISSQDDITGKYDSSVNDKTATYSEQTESSVKSRTHGLGDGDVITLRDRNYHILSIVSEGTGEAVIYKIENDNGEHFALKLYFEFRNPKNEPNFETLARIINIKDPDILALYDFGAGSPKDKYIGKYCYEILQYANGGDLLSVNSFKEKYTPDFIEKVIVVELFKGIKRLHHNDIYHCDLKPSNVFYVDSEQTDIVIGDYGSSKFFGTIENSEKLNENRELRKTSIVKGTEFYRSIEQANGIISAQNDYYSFGMILLHLLYPEDICWDTAYNKIDKKKWELIQEHIFRKQPIIAFNPIYKRLNKLIAGLTLFTNRWGESEVEDWINGKEVEVIYSRQEKSLVQPVNLGYATINSESDILNIIEARSDWYEDLIKDKTNFSSILLWLNAYTNSDIRKKFENSVQFYQPFGKKYVKEVITRFFEPHRPINIDMASFNIYSAKNLKKETVRFIEKLDEISKLEKLTDNKIPKNEKIIFHLFQLELSLLQRLENDSVSRNLINALLDKIYAVLSLTGNPSESLITETCSKLNSLDPNSAFESYLKLFYSFNSERNFKDLTNNKLNSINDLAFFFVKNQGFYSNAYLELERNLFLEKNGYNNLISVNFLDFVFEVFKGESENNIRIDELLFDSKRNYKVQYSYFKSLTNFLVSKGINTNLVYESNAPQFYEHRRKFLQSFTAEFDNFLHAVKSKHNIKDLPKDNVKELRDAFVKKSWRRWIYLRFPESIPSNNPQVLTQLYEKRKSLQDKFQWKPALLCSLIFLFLFCGYVFALTIWAEWIVFDTDSSYVKLNKDISLDGNKYYEGEYLKVYNQGTYFVCLDEESNKNCYPTSTAKNAGFFTQKQSLNEIGKFQYEYKTPRDVFKVSEGFHLNHRGRKYFYKKGQIVRIRIQTDANNKQLYCFDLTRRIKNQCFSSDTKFVDDNGNFTSYFYQLGNAIKDYKGKELFKPNKKVELLGAKFIPGKKYEVVSKDLWEICLKVDCFATQETISRLSMPDVPIILEIGEIVKKESTVGKKFAIFILIVALIIAGIVFWYSAKLYKSFELFMNEGKIDTTKFSALSQK